MNKLENYPITFYFTDHCERQGKPAMSQPRVPNLGSALHH